MTCCGGEPSRPAVRLREVVAPFRAKHPTTPTSVPQQGVCRKVELTPVDSVDNGGEAGAVPLDALGDTAAGSVASYFQGVT